MDNFEPVAFISVERGDDLIVSFFVVKRDGSTDGRSIILMRDRKWEKLIPECERGVKVSDEEYLSWKSPNQMPHPVQKPLRGSQRVGLRV